ncbi:hypothetical protein SLS54_000066 [Diplodia seriata]
MSNENKSIVARQRQQRVFPFAKLPAEIRNMIYDYALKVDYILSPWAYEPECTSLYNPNDNFCICYPPARVCGCFECFGNVPQPSPVPNLLLADKQTHREGAAMLYENVVNFHRIGDLELFLKSRRPGSKLHPRSIVINMEEPHWEVFVHLMGCAVGDWEDRVSDAAQEVAPHAFEIFSAAWDYFKSLDTDEVDDNVMELKLIFGGATDPWWTGDNWCFLMPRMLMHAVHWKLAELAPNRRFRVRGLVVNSDNKQDWDYYSQKEEWLDAFLDEWWGPIEPIRRYCAVEDDMFEEDVMRLISWPWGTGQL